MAGRSAQSVLEEFLLTSACETEKELGRGSYAAVVEVNYKGLRCAAKKIHKVFFEGQVEGYVKNFEEECRLLSQLRHPHIVQFLGVYIDGATKAPVLVMEFLPTTLAECIEKYGVMPEETCYSVFRDVILGLHFLHDRADPIIHRDLSANNVLLTSDMKAKISDLGVAKILQANRAQLFTMTKQPGTLSYMPPETMVARPRYDKKVDIFSYGVMMIHVLSGKWPIPCEPNQPNPNNPDDPDDLIALSEFDRRKEAVNLIKKDHPLLPLIKRCVSNRSLHRPASADVLQQVSAITEENMTSFTNKIEMLEWIKTLEMEGKDLHDKIERLKAENITLVAENEDMSSSLDSFRTNSMSTQFTYSKEAEILQTSLSDQRVEIEHLQGMLTLKETELRETEIQHQEEVESLRRRLRAEKMALEEDHRSNLESTLRRHNSEKSALEAELDSLRLDSRQRRETHSAALEETHALTLRNLERRYQHQVETKTRELESKDAILASRASTIESLREQLKQTLATASQPVAGNQVHVFSPGSTLKFKEIADLPAPMFYINSTIIGGYLYAGGGFGGSRTADEHVERSVYQYSITDNKWTSPFPFAPVVKFGLGQMGGKIILVGGRPRASRVTSNCYMFDEENNEWIIPPTVPPLITPRSSLTAISWKSPVAILACGGFDKHFNPLTCVEIYIQKTGTWQTSCSLPFPRAISTFTIIGNTVYMVGGYKNNSPHGYTRTVTYAHVPGLLRYQPPHAHAQRSTFSRPGEELPSRLKSQPDLWKILREVPHFFTSTTSIGGCLVAVGGQSESLGATTCITSVYVYSPVSEEWYQVGELPTACTMCATATLPTGELLVMGGCTNNGLINKVLKGSVTLDQ